MYSFRTRCLNVNIVVYRKPNSGVQPKHFSYGNFSRRSRAANTADPGLISPNFKSIKKFIAALVTYKNEDNPIKNHNTIHWFFRLSKTANSEVVDEIWQKFKLIQAFIVVLVTCKNDKDPSKNEGTRTLTTFLPLYVIWDFPDAHGQLTQQFLVRAC